MNIKTLLQKLTSNDLIEENKELKRQIEDMKNIIERSNINRISDRHHEWLKEMGWVGVTTPLEQLALIAGEIGEAVNECRGEEPTDKLGSELADIILRVLGFAKNLEIDMDFEIRNKMTKNRERGNRGRLK